jgi:hypothetical protein
LNAGPHFVESAGVTPFFYFSRTGKDLQWTLFSKGPDMPEGRSPLNYATALEFHDVLLAGM